MADCSDAVDTFIHNRNLNIASLGNVFDIVTNSINDDNTATTVKAFNSPDYISGLGIGPGGSVVGSAPLGCSYSRANMDPGNNHFFNEELTTPNSEGQFTSGPLILNTEVSVLQSNPNYAGYYAICLVSS